MAKEWIENPYLQYFCGTRCFEHRFPFDPSDFVHFRKRIGEAGCEKILKYSVRLHDEGKDRHLTNASWHVSDTTVPENNTTFPTDAKLCKKVIDHCNRIAEQEGIKLRRSYRRESKQLVRDLEWKLNESRKAARREPMALYRRVVNQRTQDKDKIYSPHKPFRRCISTGKVYKRYEFGNKVVIIVTGKQGRKIITAVRVFVGKPYDGHTIGPLLEQMERSGQALPKAIIYDRGGNGRKVIKGVELLTPDKGNKSDTSYAKQRKRKRFMLRAGIEAVIGDLKSDYRLGQNYLYGAAGIQINALLSCAAWNLKQRMEVLKEQAGRLLRRFFIRPLLPTFSYA